MKSFTFALFSGQAIRSVVVGLLIWLALRRGQEKLAEKLAGRI